MNITKTYIEGLIVIEPSILLIQEEVFLKAGIQKSSKKLELMKILIKTINQCL